MEPSDVLSARFPRAFRGYDRGAVRSFLAQVALEMQRLADRADGNDPAATAEALRALAEGMAPQDGERTPVPMPVSPPRPAGAPIDPRSGLPRTDMPRRDAAPARDEGRLRPVPQRTLVLDDDRTRVVSLEVRSGEVSIVSAPEDVTTVVIDRDVYCVAAYQGERLLSTAPTDEGVDAEAGASGDDELETA